MKAEQEFMCLVITSYNKDEIEFLVQF